MSAAEKIAEVAADGVADGLHVVGEEALAAEAVVEALDGVRVEFLLIGIAAGAAIGAFVGYKVAVKRLEDRYEKLLEEEGERLSNHYASKVQAIENREEKPALGEVVQQLGYADTPQTPQVVPPPVPRREEPTAQGPGAPPPTPPAETTSVFDAPDDNWDYAAEEVNRRDPEVPWVIHIDEHRANEPDHEQVTWTYYAGDDILANDADQEVDQDATVGVKNMGLFGHGSGDPNVVYVRNVHASMDFEIIRSPGSYAHEVRGLDEIRHSAEPERRVRRRFDDE